MPDTAHERSDELVVLSHLRWTWVWQRPQHLVSRLAEDYRVAFVEEPMVGGGVEARVLREERAGPVERFWLDVPGEERWVGFGDAAAADYAEHLEARFPARPGRIVWLYTAMALDLAEALAPELLVYDLMDDLSSFARAPGALRLRHQAALRRADVVFTGGRSLHAGVTSHRRDDVHCFPSGVEPEHFAPAIALRPARRARPVAGYVGVVDERIDLALLADLAARLADWDIVMVGPVAKIDPASLPQASNLHWVGSRAYDELPKVMAGFDVALMPFALNEATRSISPTKTLEYFAAGLPVVSTRVPDVVADHAAHVALVDDGAGAAAACRQRRGRAGWSEQRRTAGVLDAQRWDTIAARMATILDDARDHGRAEGLA